MKQTIFLLTAFTIVSTALNAQSRVVLIEQFTNSSCPPCGAASPSVFAYANANPSQVAVIAYHTLFPYNNDSMYFENPTEATQRVNYYSVAGVPSSIMDGNVYSGSTNPFIATISTSVNNRLTVAPRYTIQASGLTLNGNQLSGSINFKSLTATNLGETLKAQVVVVEKNVLKSAYAASPGANSETEYGYVMRKMLPDASGTPLVNLALNGTDVVNVNWTLTNIKNKGEVRVVAFVQNTTTKEVYQAQLFDVAETPLGITRSEKAGSEARIYPNPASNEFSVAFDKEQSLRSVALVDRLGRVVFEEQLHLTTTLLTRKVDVEAGVYFIKINTATGNQIHKLVITR